MRKQKPCREDILTQLLQNSLQLDDKINLFFEQFDLTSILNECDLSKRNGYKTQDILKYLVDLRFNGISSSTNRKVCIVQSQCNYDSVCNLKKRQQADWVGFTTKLSLTVRDFLDQDKELTGELKQGLFILDDSPYKRNCSKKTELISKQWDHADGSVYYGYRWSHLGYFSNGTYLPVNSVPVSTDDPEKIICQAKPVKTEQASKKRALTTSKLTEVCLEQIDLALKEGFKASYVLQDSWFTSPKMLFSLLQRGLYGIGMVKNSKKLRFEFEGEMLSTGEIFERLRFDLRGLKDDAVICSTIVKAHYEDHVFDVKLVFVEAGSGDKDFICIACADTDLSSSTIVKLYKVRWSIEIYFGDCKDADSIDSTHQSQCLSLESVYADLAITTLVYLILAFYKALQPEEEDFSLRDCFYRILRECRSINRISWLASIIGNLLGEFSQKLGYEFEALIDLTVKNFLSQQAFTEHFDRVDISGSKIIT